MAFVYFPQSLNKRRLNIQKRLLQIRMCLLHYICLRILLVRLDDAKVSVCVCVCALRTMNPWVCQAFEKCLNFVAEVRSGKKVAHSHKCSTAYKRVCVCMCVCKKSAAEIAHK